MKNRLSAAHASRHPSPFGRPKTVLGRKNVYNPHFLETTFSKKGLAHMLFGGILDKTLETPFKYSGLKKKHTHVIAVDDQTMAYPLVLLSHRSTSPIM